MKFIYAYTVGTLLIAGGCVFLPAQPSYNADSTQPDYQAMVVASPSFKVILAGAAVIIITAPINLYHYIRHMKTVVPEPVLPLRSSLRKSVTFPPITVGGSYPTRPIEPLPEPVEEPVEEPVAIPKVPQYRGPAITYVRLPREL